jgi:hypothetical protein
MMIAKLQRVEEAAANESLVFGNVLPGGADVAEHADYRVLQRPDPSGRRLRNHLILANAIAWIAIIVLIRLVFF